MKDCILCNEDGGQIIYKNKLLRVILAGDTLYPGFVRLILNPHYKEMSDLSSEDAASVFTTVLTIEKLVRQIFNPDKINLASLGNVVPHLHWHIIPRFYNDAHYPNPIWGLTTNPKYVPSQELFDLESKLSDQLAATRFNE
jgi:diadenosine tetraphosphate (Ap4A) HIT family hydrolase